MSNGCDGGSSAGCWKCNPSSWISVPVSNILPTGWVCPKCGRVYGPVCLECHWCNILISNGIAVPQQVGTPVKEGT